MMAQVANKIKPKKENPAARTKGGKRQGKSASSTDY